MTVTQPAGVEAEQLELDQLVAAAIAGTDDLRVALSVLSRADMRRILLDETQRRADALLVQARGDKGRAYDLLLAERRRWRAD